MATPQQIREHIATFAPIIQRLAREKGYKVCSPIIAQSITESVSKNDKSGWSFLKYKHHNMFGLKAGRDWLKAGKPAVSTKTGEYYSGQYVTVNDYFRSFSDFTSGIEGYFNFINTKRYANLKGATTPEDYIRMIMKDGYCTSPYYFDTNMSHINNYGLRKYDEGMTDTRKNLPVLKVGSTGEYVAAWQNFLEALGFYDGKTNGVFDEHLKACVINYQKAMGLVADGIIGIRTWQTVPNVL